MKPTQFWVGSLLLFSLTYCRLPGAQASDPNAKTGRGDEARRSATRLSWNLDTLAGDYERYGRHNPKWDKYAREALTNFAQARCRSDTEDVEGFADKAGAVAEAAMTNGCTDPLVRYLHARYGMELRQHTPAEHKEEFRSAAEDLSKSGYSAIRKFYAALRASERLNPGGTNTPPVVHEWRHKASQFLNEAVKDKTMPIVEVYEACEQLLEGVQANAAQYEAFYYAFEPTVFTNWPADASLYLLKGIFYVKHAWHARGGEYAYKVTDAGWDLFAKRLAEAEKALDRAWQLNPRDIRIARQMMSLELGQGKGRNRMEMWFRRGTELNPDYYDLFSAKLYYLEPKWFGSRDDMLEFGRECVASKKWGGHVPLILRDAHEALVKYEAPEDRANYWKRAEVWADLKSAFEKFFKLNPDEAGWRHNYALYAYRAADWDVLNQQLPILGYTNYDFFGGQQQFEKMVRQAKEHQKK